MTDVVTAFLCHRPAARLQVLVLRRSDKVGSYQGRWAGVSGFLESESPYERALIEIEEETGIPPSGVRLLAQAGPLHIPDEAISRNWRVHPFLFEASDPQQIRTDWEHVESRWVEPAQLRELETVPGLADVLDRLLAAWQPDDAAKNAKIGRT